MSIKLFDLRPRQFSWRSWVIGWLWGVGVLAIGHGVEEVHEPLVIGGLICLLGAELNRRCLPLKK